jgi:predicted DCC family thiol-disulfide oxidoreductase YuxK
LWKLLPIKFSNFLYEWIARNKNKLSRNTTCISKPK